jgi:hypothetical protein
MNFNEKYLSIPPYISTGWSNVRALQMSGNLLVITLSDDSQVHVPDLDFEELEQVFEAHARYLESQIDQTKQSMQTQQPQQPQQPQQSQQTQPNKQEHAAEVFGDTLLGQNAGLPFKLGGMQGVEGLGAAMQHNIEHANAPDLPQEILEKIASIATIIAPEDVNEVPQPEPHCNCPHCQIARAINEGLGNTVRPFSGDEVVQEEIVEKVLDEELSFQQWEIQQTGDKLFTVVNKLVPEEKYSVFLGEPVGCTCGNEGCEHMLAVLHS